MSQFTEGLKTMGGSLSGAKEAVGIFIIVMLIAYVLVKYKLIK